MRSRTIHPLRVEFSHRETERDFQRHQLNRTQASLRLTLLICAAFYVGFALTNVASLGYSREALLLFIARMLVATTAMMGLYFVRIRPDSIAVRGKRCPCASGWLVLPTEIARARRHKLWLTLIVCDVDHFKSINDTDGRQAGDAVLRHLSALLQSMTRQHLDSVVRYGGEEFLLVLTQTDLSGAVSLADRLRRQLLGIRRPTPAVEVSQRQLVLAC
ncbi:GGDEF domain-containing protein [Cupriavidus necator]